MLLVGILRMVLMAGLGIIIWSHVSPVGANIGVLVSRVAELVKGHLGMRLWRILIRVVAAAFSVRMIVLGQGVMVMIVVILVIVSVIMTTS